MKTQGGGEMWIYSFLISALGGDQWLDLPFGRFKPVKEDRYPLNRRLVGFQRRSGLFEEEKTMLPPPCSELRMTRPVPILHASIQTVLSSNK